MLDQDSDSGINKSRSNDEGRELYGAELPELERAILATIAYRDLFDFAVTAEEIHRYLHNVTCEIGDVRAVLNESEFVDTHLASDGEFFALKHRRSLLELRRERGRLSEELWRKALWRGQALTMLPFVRMVAVTGSLAADNPERGADTDFMLVTEGGRLWSVRAFASTLALLDRMFWSGELCPNYLVSTEALTLESSGIYVAQELSQMVPIFGLDIYDSLRDANQWTFDYLPNASGAPPVSYRCEPKVTWFRKMCEMILRTPLGDLFESWESSRKLHKYNGTEFLHGRLTPFSKEATGHRRVMKQTVENAFSDRLKGPPEYRGHLRVLIGQAYHMYLDPKLHKSMQPFPPLGSFYAAGVARSMGHDVRVHDSMLSNSTGEWPCVLRINDPDLVVLYEDNFNYLTKMCLLRMRDTALDMIRASKKRGAHVLVCSSDSTDEPETYLHAGADFVLIGEGEDSFAELLQMLNDDRDLGPQGIPGIAFLDDNGDLVQTGRRPVIRHIDNLPEPAWDLCNLEQYREIWMRRHGHFAVNMVTTRGCPYHCNWCAKPIWGQRYNARSPNNVVEELLWLRQLASCDYVWFMDDIFGLKPRWISQFADALDAAGVKIRFKCLSRPDILLRNGETKALARAGCDIVWMGAESGSQKILDAMEKGTTVENILTACESLREHGVRVGLFIQFGYPGETKLDIRATVKMIRQIMPDELGISVSYPLPGTRFYDRVKSELGVTRNWQDSNDLAMLFKGPFNTGFYRALHGYVHSDLAMRRAWLDLTVAGRRRNLSTVRQMRKVGLLGYSIARAGWFAMAMAVLSRLPHRAMEPFQPELNPVAAAIPSDQNSG
jgi:anaerobic magnesium-protoporphyrin IX monomethyl ester cyclase